MKKENTMNGQFNRGFTLIELMVTMAVAAIILAFAVPNYQTFVLNSRMSAQSNDFLSALQLARSEAVKQGTRVSVCTSANSTTCTLVGNWEQGWLVFVDINQNGTLATAAQLIRVFPPLSGGSTLTGSANVVNLVSFEPNGATSLAMGGAETVSLCPPAPAAVPGRDIQISASGRARVQNPPVAACP